MLQYDARVAQSQFESNILKRTKLETVILVFFDNALNNTIDLVRNALKMVVRRCATKRFHRALPFFLSGLFFFLLLRTLSNKTSMYKRIQTYSGSTSPTPLRGWDSSLKVPDIVFCLKFVFFALLTLDRLK